MASYETHAQAASDILAQTKITGMAATHELRAQVAQVEALLALAAAVAGRRSGAPQPPQYPPHAAPDSY
ncbi:MULTISPECIES: hypothetical protein [unclassified Streptomyces]|uniref:hypothetical protein n=1 Tax=unclassified Streptomyces TaxID=2593676 RepID=UPI0005F89C46|nr:MULTISPECIES: hypothetical protein [unclassified Streptomyces]KJY39893.1 hypothetical protein VR45_01610 [Streptomyces sp. NRRL S-495]KOV29826.1 hypothetical protein ADK60_17335 [Streptomyces sp. XY431]